MSFDRLLRRVDRWDWSVSANPHSTEVWARVYPNAARSLEAGYPRNDVLATATADRIAAIRRALGVRPGQRAILYAPTHRDYETAFSSRLDLVRFCEALGPESVVLVRAHPSYEGAGLPDHPALVDVCDHPRIEELCLAADALVTDYSSVMFDYAHLDRPIVVHAPDWETYRTVRGSASICCPVRPATPPGRSPRPRTGWPGSSSTAAGAARRTRRCGPRSGPGSVRTATGGPRSGWYGRCCWARRIRSPDGPERPARRRRQRCWPAITVARPTTTSSEPPQVHIEVRSCSTVAPASTISRYPRALNG